MKVGLLTKEYPPEVYGGAGVHVAELTRELGHLVDLEVHCFGAEREESLVAASYGTWEALEGDAAYLGALRTMATDLAMVHGVGAAELVHSHTWYANLAGHLAKLVHDVPHVVTTHSLEPLRPWKREQLGGGYSLSSFCERTAIEAADAVIAVSDGMKADVLASYPAVDPARIRVVHNGVNPDVWRRVGETQAVEANGIDLARPYAVFVGRITRQKGVVHLLDAAEYLPEGTQLVVCAGAPDTPEIAGEFRDRVARLADAPVDVVWIEQMLPRDQLVQILSHATVFVCPSVYEPFGIVNLEAMACELPVVASRVGGIPEVVLAGETGWLVDLIPGEDAVGTPEDPDRFARGLAEAVTSALTEPGTSAAMGRAGRQRVEQRFAWPAIAARTIEVYEDVLAARRGR